MDSTNITYKRIRKEMAWEDERIKERMGWSLVIQAALFYAITQSGANAYLGKLIFMGIITAIGSSISISGAILMLIHYHKRMKELRTALASADLYPQIKRPITPVVLGLAGPALIQIAALAVWLFIWLF